MRNRPRDRGGRWDLFLLLNRKPGPFNAKRLQTIPEEGEMSSEHHCDRRSSDAKDAAPDQRGQNAAKHSLISEEGQKRNRRQWEATPPDNMRSLYRSLSSFEISAKNEERGRKHQHKKETALPPLRTKGVLSQSSGKIIHSSHRDISDSGRKGNRYSNEWIVTRPSKRRPKDELTLEGLMNMETTFSSTYEAVAKEISKQKSDQPVVSCSQTYTEYMPTSTSRPSRRRRKERPKTTLKVGGEGHYRTLTRDSFKNFVVVKDPVEPAVPIRLTDLGPNDSRSRAAGEVEDASGDKNTSVADAHIVQADVRKGSSGERHEPPQPVVPSDKVNENAPGEQEQAANLEADFVQGELKLKKPSTGGTSEDVDLDDEIRRINGTETRAQEAGSAGRRSHSSGRKSRSDRKVDSRFRHLSLPRSRHQHKNESQLHFYGDMDFETTTRRLYRNCEEKEERGGTKRRVSRARDLFKPSDEIDLFNRHPGEKFDSATTYALCFQDRQYCPAVDLNTSNSEYVFREKTGSHKYYCSLSRLA